MTHDELDNMMNNVFADARPDEGLEDRLVARMRKARLPRLNLHPFVYRAAVGVAAAIMLGGVGFAVTREGEANRDGDASNSPQIVQSITRAARRAKSWSRDSWAVSHLPASWLDSSASELVRAV